jgi:hypothetical protein
VTTIPHLVVAALEAEVTNTTKRFRADHESGTGSIEIARTTIAQGEVTNAKGFRRRNKSNSPENRSPRIHPIGAVLADQSNVLCKVPTRQTPRGEPPQATNRSCERLYYFLSQEQEGSLGSGSRLPGRSITAPITSAQKPPTAYAALVN